MAAIKNPDPKPITIRRKPLRVLTGFAYHLKLALARLMENFDLNWLRKIQYTKNARTSDTCGTDQNTDWNLKLQ